MNATATKTEKKGLKTSPFDPAEYISDTASMQDLLDVTLEDRGNDLHSVGFTLDVLFRAWALTELERKTELDRSELNQILLGAGNPTPEILTKIAEALGLKMPDHFGKNLPHQPQTHIESQTFYRSIASL
ncbi:MAG: helix-turn-helix domain-containing protein [Acetobacter sp.]|nr:helix-turn-helix domain-containing protein [Acetobacter sp.]